MHSIVDSATHNGPLSSALARTFRGKLCDVILRDRIVTTFEKDQVIYDAADRHPTFFFLQKGFVKVGSITECGHERDLPLFGFSRRSSLLRLSSVSILCSVACI